MTYFWKAVVRDGPELGGALAGLVLLVAVGELLRRWGASPSASRRLVHVGVGLFVAATPWLFEDPPAVYVLGATFVVANGAAWWKGWLPGLHAARRESVGTVTFPLVLLPALAIGWSADPGRIWAFQLSFLLLAVCDPLAAWVGTTVARPRRYRIGRHWKSVAGSATFGISAMLLAGGMLLVCRMAGIIDWTLAEVLVMSGVVALVSTGAEALGSGGWDNVVVVLAALLTLVFADEHPDVRLRMGVAAAAGVAFGVVVYRLDALDGSGALAGGLLAWSLLTVGWAWAVPGFIFFVLSSLLSRVGARRKERASHFVEKPGARDAGQVFANGGVAWLLLAVSVVVPGGVGYVGFLGAFAAATADTWATELGALGPGRPRLITTGARVPVGTSGAVSLTGTVAAVAGAGVIAVSAWPFVPQMLPLRAVGGMLLLITGSGVAGAFVDSLIGATLQAQYVDPETGEVTERPPADGARWYLQRGVAWMRNDLVNGIGTASGAGLAMACFPWL